MIRTLLSVSAVGIVAGVASVAGSVWADANSSGTSRPSGPQASRAAGPVRFTAFTDNDGTKSAVVLTGVIGDYGQAVRISTDGSSEREYDQLDLVVARGSFRLSISGIERQLVTAFARFPANRNTCSGTVTAKGTTPIVAGSGTGAYQGISGEFTLTVAIHEVDSWPRCGALLSETVVTDGSGRVSFG
jgi:hypothetical protein